MVADPRNPLPGTRLVREWNGAEHTVTVLQDGYELRAGNTSRSRPSREPITGTELERLPLLWPPRHAEARPMNEHRQ